MSTGADDRVRSFHGERQPQAGPDQGELSLVDWHSHMLAETITPPEGCLGRWPGLRHRNGSHEMTLGGEFYRAVDERTFRVEARRAAMAGTGVARQVLSPPPFTVAFDGPQAEHATLASMHNDFTAAVVADDPAHFAMLGMLPYGDTRAVFRELDRLAAVVGVAGICFTAHRDDWLCTLEHIDFWQRVSDDGLLVFVHPADTDMCSCDLATAAAFGAAMPMATGRTATRLITSGVLAAVPELQVLLAHAGGVLPVILDRLNHGWNMGHHPNLEQAPVAYARTSFWVDSMAYGPGPLRLVGATLGLDRLVYGSDFPFAAMIGPGGLAALEPDFDILSQVTLNGGRLWERTRQNR